MKEFTSLEAFAMHIGELVVKEKLAEVAALNKAAKLVQKEAKAELGTYQSEIGDIMGWAELADSTKADRLRQGYTENDPGLRSGEMRDSIQTTTMEGEGGYVAYVGSDDQNMVYFELGTEKQPPRSVLAGSALRKEKEVHEIIGQAVHNVLMGREVHQGMMIIVGGDEAVSS
jgi:hypothetical protein